LRQVSNSLVRRSAGKQATLWFLAGLIYFGLIGGHKLVYSPEEEFAIRERQKALGHM